MKQLIFAGMLCVLLFSNCAWSKGKLDFMFGGYGINAQTGSASGSLSGIGLYLISYRYALQPSLEVGLGYSLSATKTIGGDLEYGPDLSLAYFPMTSTASESFEEGEVHYISSTYWRPYVEASFHQRQYQSTATSYAGFGAGFGAEYQINERWSVKMAFRYLALTGPSNATANEMNLLGGISYPF